MQRAISLHGAAAYQHAYYQLIRVWFYYCWPPYLPAGSRLITEMPSPNCSVLPPGRAACGPSAPQHTPKPSPAASTLKLSTRPYMPPCESDRTTHKRARSASCAVHNKQCDTR